jgi:hypothetical protein
MTVGATIRSLLATLLLGACMGTGAVNGDATTTTSTSTSTSPSAASTTTSTMATTTTTLNDEEVVAVLKEIHERSRL